MSTACSMTTHVNSSAANVESRHDNCETQQAQCQSDLFSFPPFASLNEHPDWIANFGNTLRKTEVDEHAVEAQASSTVVRLGNLVFRS